MKAKINKLQIKFTDPFNKQRKAAPYEIKVAFREALEFFIEDPLHPHLRNHPLKEKLAGYRSVDITGDWRAIFKEKQAKEQKVITFYKIGTHKNLYKK